MFRNPARDWCHYDTVRIECVEIQNYRKLASVRIDFSEKTTLLVGANNSGKTSAMVALRSFLQTGVVDFRTNDITLANWAMINALGDEWLAATDDAPRDAAASWGTMLPSLDVWLRAEDKEVHQVSDLIPNLDWSGGLLGVRIAIEPKDANSLYRDFREAWKRSDALKHPSNQSAEVTVPSADTAGAKTDRLTALNLWPIDLVDFLGRRLSRYFSLQYFVLDPAKLVPTERDLAAPQALPVNNVALATNPLEHLIRIDEINAQRGLGDRHETAGDGHSGTISDGAKLSSQLGEYYRNHLNPTDLPDASDLEALGTIADAQDEFDKRLGEAFKKALTEIEQLGYPGVTDPRIRVASKLSTTDSLDHESAVSFLVDVAGGGAATLQLPEGHNGLGYQNLISMIFRLMSFRDRWMRVGKANQHNRDKPIEPIHLVLIEEPEAHLHVQVQQVFAKKAYDVLRNHDELGEAGVLKTQLIISTHSSHVAHELPFSSLRYFRRLPAGSQAAVPTSSVISLAHVFGPGNDTEKFATRYLRAQHAELFFADAVILVEGPAERMLVPNFIREHFPFLNSAYVTMLEIGGSHAHRLRPLIDALRIPTLVVTDIDATKDGSSCPIEIGTGLVTSNPTLKAWSSLPTGIDELLSAAEPSKELNGDLLFSVRFAYQVEVAVALPPAAEVLPAYPGTFEDALILANIAFFATLPGNGFTSKVRHSIAASATVKDLSKALFDNLQDAKKAEFALDIIGADQFTQLQIPGYILSGLQWLETRIKKQALETAETVIVVVEEELQP